MSEQVWRIVDSGTVFTDWTADDPEWPYPRDYRVPVEVEAAIRAPYETMIREVWNWAQNMAGCNVCGEPYDVARGCIGHEADCFVPVLQELVGEGEGGQG
jgi:hypothetical protein